MSRYLGPKVKILRAVGMDLPGLSAKSMEKRPYPPGQHGHGRRKLSEYAIRVLETKKLRMNYGLSEGQLRRIVVEAHKKRTATAAVVEFLERRLDNVVFRAGFARTIPAARQLVGHGHVLVNGRRCDISSARLSTNDVVTLKKVPEAQPEPRFPAPEWLEVDLARGTAQLKGLPDESSLLLSIDMKLIIEHYATKL